MDIFFQKRFVAWLIIVLVVLNLSTLSIFLFTRGRGPQPPPPAGNDSNRVRDFLKRELNLTPDQVTRYQGLQAAHAQRTRTLEEEIHDCRRRMMDQLAVPQPDLALVERLAGEIGRRQAEVDKTTFYHFRDLQALCTADQRARLTEIFREVLRAIRPPGRPEPPRRD